MPHTAVLLIKVGDWEGSGGYILMLGNSMPKQRESMSCCLYSLLGIQVPCGEAESARLPYLMNHVS